MYKACYLSDDGIYKECLFEDKFDIHNKLSAVIGEEGHDFIYFRKFWMEGKVVGTFKLITGILTILEI